MKKLNTSPWSRRCSTQDRRSCWRKWKGRLLALGFGIFVSLLLAEILLRCFGISYPIFFQTDSLTGTRLIPNKCGRYTQEGSAHVRISADGWRDHEHSVAKPPGTYRIAVLGDSFTCALQVEEEETFCSILEKHLRVDGAPVEVLNFGVDGYGTGSELLTLRHRVWKYEPDLVLLAFFTGNDIANNSRALNEADYMPYFVYENDKLRVDTSFLDSRSFRRRNSWFLRAFVWGSDYSRVIQLTNRLRHAWRARSRRAAHPRTGSMGYTAPGMPNMIYVEPSDPAWSEAWRVTEGLLQAMLAECRSRKAAFAIVTLTNPIQVHPDVALRRDLEREIGVKDLFYPDRRIREFGELEEIGVLNLAPDFQQRAEESKVPLHGFEGSLRGHWNQTAHRWAGETIARWLRDKVLGK